MATKQQKRISQLVEALFNDNRLDDIVGAELVPSSTYEWGPDPEQDAKLFNNLLRTACSASMFAFVRELKGDKPVFDAVVDAAEEDLAATFGFAPREDFAQRYEVMSFAEASMAAAALWRVIKGYAGQTGLGCGWLLGFTKPGRGVTDKGLPIVTLEDVNVCVEPNQWLHREFLRLKPDATNNWALAVIAAVNGGMKFPEWSTKTMGKTEGGFNGAAEAFKSWVHTVPGNPEQNQLTRLARAVENVGGYRWSMWVNAYINGKIADAIKLEKDWQIMVRSTTMASDIALMKASQTYKMLKMQALMEKQKSEIEDQMYQMTILSHQTAMLESQAQLAAMRVDMQKRMQALGLVAPTPVVSTVVAATEQTEAPKSNGGLNVFPAGQVPIVRRQ